VLILTLNNNHSTINHSKSSTDKLNVLILEFLKNEEPQPTKHQFGANKLPLMDQFMIRVITKLPNTEQSSQGKGKTHKSINRQNQSTTVKPGKLQWPSLGTGISKEMVG
jgi:hypothetical protein